MTSDRNTYLLTRFLFNSPKCKFLKIFNVHIITSIFIIQAIFLSRLCFIPFKSCLCKTIYETPILGVALKQIIKIISIYNLYKGRFKELERELNIAFKTSVKLQETCRKSELR